MHIKGACASFAFLGELYSFLLQNFAVLFKHNYFRYGPMARYWCTRFEAKHNYFNNLAQKTKQFKNIAMSLAHRHQQLTCYNLSKSGSLVKGEQGIHTSSLQNAFV